MFAEHSPESVELVKAHGHEIGCHGYDHAPEKVFDELTWHIRIHTPYAFRKRNLF
jgi:peptidoglycan/xylan/chitin deacetylase (PgdA/CDA1 family)